MTAQCHWGVEQAPARGWVPASGAGVTISASSVPAAVVVRGGRAATGPGGMAPGGPWGAVARGTPARGARPVRGGAPVAARRRAGAGAVPGMVVVQDAVPELVQEGPDARRRGGCWRDVEPGRRQRQRGLRTRGSAVAAVGGQQAGGVGRAMRNGGVGVGSGRRRRGGRRRGGVEEEAGATRGRGGSGWSGSRMWRGTVDGVLARKARLKS
jgi:hypothetical protein